MIPRPAVRPIRGLGIAVVALLVGDIVVQLSRIAAFVMEMDLLRRDMRGALVTGAQIRALNWRLSTGANVADLFLVVTAVVWLIWQHRAHANLSGLGATQLRFTPGWAVGWWCVPLANLVKPFQTMRELWKASGDTYGWPALPTTALVGWWWGSYLGAQFVLGVASAVREDASGDAALVGADGWAIAALATRIAAAVLAALLVWAVVTRQAKARTAVPPRRDLATVPPRPA